MAESTLGSLAIYLTANTKQFDEAISGAKNTINKFESSVNLAAASVVTGLAASFTTMFYKAVKFNEEMTRSLAIMSGVSAQARKELEQTAKTISTQYLFSTTELAKGYFYLFSAGKDLAQSQRLLADVARFAQAGQFDLATATTLLADAQSALGMSSKNAAEDQKNLIKISDVLVKANTIANANVQQFSQALTNEAAAAMRMFGISLEEGVAVLAAFADQGVKGEVAGSSLARMLRLIIPAATKNKEAFDQLGIKVFDASGNMRKISDIIVDMENAFKGMSVEQKSAALEMLGFKAKIQGVILPLLGASDRIKQYEETLKSAGGTSAEVADNQLNSLSSRFKIFTVNVWSAMSAGTGFTKKVSELADYFKSATTYIQNLDAQTKTFTSKLLGLTAIVGTLAISFKALNIQAIVTGFFAMGGAAGLSTIAFAKQVVTLSAMTGATVTQSIAALAHTVIVGGLTAAYATLQVALIAVIGTFGTLAIAAGVAFVGFKIGEWIGNLDIVKSKLEWIGDWFYDVSGLQAESDALDQKLKEFNANRKKAVEKPVTTKIPEEKTSPQIIESLKIRQEFEEKMLKIKLQSMSVSERINYLEAEKIRLSAMAIDEGYSDAERTKAHAEAVDASVEIARLKAKQEDDISSSKEKFEKHLEKFRMDAMSGEEKINYLLEKRKALQDALLNSGEEKTYDIKDQILSIDEHLKDLQGTDFSASNQKANDFSAAVSRGTAEAYRLELAKSTKQDDTQKKTEDNTKQTAQNTASLLNVMNTFVSEVGVA
jgi:TP901 family phage tail tape measure protein